MAFGRSRFAMWRVEIFFWAQLAVMYGPCLGCTDIACLLVQACRAQPWALH